MSFVLKELQVRLSLKYCAIAAAKDVEIDILRQWQSFQSPVPKYD